MQECTMETTLSVCLPVPPSVCLSVCPTIHPSVCLFVCLYIHPSIISVFLSVCFSVSLFYYPFLVLFGFFFHFSSPKKRILLSFVFLQQDQTQIINVNFATLIQPWWLGSLRRHFLIQQIVRLKVANGGSNPGMGDLYTIVLNKKGMDIYSGFSMCMCYMYV